MLRLLPLAALALIPTASAQQFWTVDDDGPADFISIQAAVDTVGDGDVLVVRPGVYQRFVVDGKGLTIQSEVPGGALIQVALIATTNFEVRNLASGQAVHIRGFVTQGIGAAEHETVVLDNCDGPILIEDCDVNGFGEPMIIRDCDSVTFVNTELVAPPTFASYSAFSFFGFATYAGMVATDSNVFLYDCEVRGSSGGDSGDVVFITIPPGPSAGGVVLRGSTLLASGCVFGGGSGGSGATGCFAGEDGSPGLELTGGTVNPDSTARLLDCVITGGTGGTGSCGLADGADAPAQTVDPGSQVINLPGTARSFHAASPVVGGNPLDITLTGEQDDDALLHVSAGADNGLFLAPFNITLHMQLPVQVLVLGAIPPSGVLNLPVPIPPLPGFEGFRFVGQTLFLSGSGFFDGGPSTLLVLGDAL